MGRLRGRNDALGAGKDVVSIGADLVQPDACAAVVGKALSTFGRLDVLFNNAGVGTMVVGGTVESIELERWDLALDVNVRGMYLVSRAAVPAMRAAGGGAIVNTASVSAFQGSRSRPSHAYATSKGAVLALTRAMASSYGRDGIRVNAICPGTIRTRLTADVIAEAERAAAAGETIPLGRVGEPADIAHCARDLDFAIRWGFGWKLGPLELWQAAGWQQVAKWIEEDIAAGKAEASEAFGSFMSQSAQDLQRGKNGWQQSDGDLERIAHLLRPRARSHIHQQGGGGVGIIHA